MGGPAGACLLLGWVDRSVISGTYITVFLPSGLCSQLRWSRFLGAVLNNFPRSDFEGRYASLTSPGLKYVISLSAGGLLARGGSHSASTWPNAIHTIVQLPGGGVRPNSLTSRPWDWVPPLLSRMGVLGEAARRSTLPGSTSPLIFPDRLALTVWHLLYRRRPRISTPHAHAMGGVR